jgi:cobalt/nickel transport system permease protein
VANPFPIDAYAYSNRLRWAHPAEKMVFALVTLSLCLFFRSWAVSAAVVAVMTMLLWRTAGVRPLVFWQFLRLPLGFIVLGVLTIVVILVPPEAAATAWAVPLGNWHIGVTPASATEGARVLAVSLGSIASTLFLALTTPLADITDQLRRWRVPSLFIELMVIVYRFIFVLLETAESMYTAQQARLGYSTTRRALRSAAVLASNLYLRANARATALFTALTARGYNGDLRVLMDRPAWSVRRILAFTALDLLFVCVGLRSA